MKESSQICSKKAGIIIKTVERCNINCTYCYYFNKSDQAWKNRKPHISLEMIDVFNSFISQGIQELNITNLLVEFHGGEPLLQRKDHFILMCQKIQSTAQKQNLSSIRFALQTNGILLDKEWIKIFKDNNVGIGISLDGTKAQNDVYRLDKKGNSTYEKVIAGIKLCQDQDYNFGLLSVVNPKVNGSEVYDHFTKELQLKHFDFLLPDANHGVSTLYPAEEYGRFMIEVFDSWIKENSDKPRVFIRYCVNALELFFGNYSRVEGFGKRNMNVLPLTCVSNNGDIGPLDDLRTCIPEKFVQYNIKDTSWKDFLADKFFDGFLHDMQNSPDKCKKCCYDNVCGGGTYGHRFNPVTMSFNNPSVYCSGLKMFWKRVITFLLNHNFPEEKLKQILMPSLDDQIREPLSFQKQAAIH